MRLTDGQAALIDRIATRAPVRQVLVIEAIGHTRVCRLAKKLHQKLDHSAAVDFVDDHSVKFHSARTPLGPRNSSEQQR